MSEHQDEDDTTPLEYFISGLVVLLFGLLYFFINHGENFIGNAGDSAFSLAAPAVTAAPVSGVGNKLLADNNTGVAEMPVVKDEIGDEGQSEADAEKDAEKDKAQQRLAIEKAEREQADKERMAAEGALREQLAAERERADDAVRKLEEAQKLLAAEKALNAEAAKATVPEIEQTPVQQIAQPAAVVADDNVMPVYKLPDGTEIAVSDDGFEGAAKVAMAQPPEEGVALMNEPMLFDDISFESGSATLSGRSQQQINVLAALMNTYQDRKILIRGHTDNIGGLNANSLLSLTRSDSLKKELVGLGIDRNRIKLEGVGQLEPLASNDTAEGRSKNRRIELILIE